MNKPADRFLYCVFSVPQGPTVLPRITPQGSYLFEVVKKGELFEGGVIRGMGSYYFDAVILPKSLRFLLKLASHMTIKTELASGNNVLQLLNRWK